MPDVPSQTSFAYDADRDLRRVARPGRATVSYEKDAAGQLDYVALGALEVGGRAIDFAQYAGSETSSGQAPGRLKYIAGPGAITSTSISGVSSGRRVSDSRAEL